MTRVSVKIVFSRVSSTPSTALALMTPSPRQPEQRRHTPSPSVPLPQPIHNTPEEPSNPR